jgi:hypothetical protein
MTLVEVVKIAASYSFFFAASSGIFLLMRLAVDEKEMDEIHLEDEEAYVETARQAMLSDDVPPTPAPETPLPVEPKPEPETVAIPAAPLAFDTASPAELPPPVVSTEISTPPDEEPLEEKPPPSA